MHYEYMENNKKRVPYVTVVLVAINVIIYLLLDWFLSNGDILFNKGVMYVPAMVDGGQYYRLFSSMFLHWDYDHVLNNMIMLAILGYQVEEDYGPVKLGITYLVSGLMGNVISGGIELCTGQYSLAAGASGAVFGIFGVMLVIMFKNRKSMNNNYGIRLAILFCIAIFGNMQEGVDWVAHLGGALTGVVMASIMYRVPSDVIYR